MTMTSELREIGEQLQRHFDDGLGKDYDQRGDESRVSLLTRAVLGILDALPVTDEGEGCATILPPKPMRPFDLNDSAPVEEDEVWYAAMKEFRARASYVRFDGVGSDELKSDLAAVKAIVAKAPRRP